MLARGGSGFGLGVVERSGERGILAVLSQTVEYALRVMVTLAAFPEERVAAAALAVRTRAPADYLSKVLQGLAKARLIAGRRGVGGGYRLARPAAKISVLEVIRAVGEINRITKCPLEIKGHANPALCPLHHMLDEAIGELIRVFDGKTLDQLIEWPGEAPLCRDGSRPVALGLR